MKNLCIFFGVCGVVVYFVWAFAHAIERTAEIEEMKQAEICELYPEAHCGQ